MGSSFSSPGRSSSFPINHPSFLHPFHALPLTLDFLQLLLVLSRVEFQGQAASSDCSTSFPGVWAQIPVSRSCIPAFHLLPPCPSLPDSKDPHPRFLRTRCSGWFGEG